MKLFLILSFFITIPFAQATEFLGADVKVNTVYLYDDYERINTDTSLLSELKLPDPEDQEMTKELPIKFNGITDGHDEYFTITVRTYFSSSLAADNEKIEFMVDNIPLLDVEKQNSVCSLRVSEGGIITQVEKITANKYVKTHIFRIETSVEADTGGCTISAKGSTIGSLMQYDYFYVTDY